MRIDRNTAPYTPASGKRSGTAASKHAEEGKKIQETAPNATVEKPSGDITLETLKELFPGMDIQIADLNGVSDIRDYAKSHYGNFQLIISQEVLDKLNSDKDFRKQFELSVNNARQEIANKMEKLIRSGKAVLGSGIVMNEDGSVSQWVASKDLKQTNCFAPSANNYAHAAYSSSFYQKDGSITKIKTKDGKTITISKKLSYRPAKDLARIARAVNQQLVKSAMSGIQGQIYLLKTSKGNKQTIKQLVGQAEQVLMKAKIKIKNLKKEELLEGMQKNAKSREQLKKAIYLKRVLEENRTKRISREYGQIRDYYPTPIERERQREQEKMERELASIGVSGMSGGLQSYCPVAGNIAVSDMGASQGSTGVFVDISL